MLPTKLTIYNGALLHLGERNITALTEDSEIRRLLDTVYDGGAIDRCLSHGQWKFATRSSKLEPSPGVTPAFGYTNGYEIPDDFVLLCSFCSDEYHTTPILGYEETAGYWLTDADDVYLRYISNHASYGGNWSLWPESFIRYVELHFASRIVMRIKPEMVDHIDVLRMRALLEARNQDAWGLPTKFRPSGSWSSSRGGGVRGDRGHRGRLIG